MQKCNYFRARQGGGAQHGEQQAGGRRQAGLASGSPPQRVRGAERPAGEAGGGTQGGDQDVPEVRGEAQAHREPGVCQERHTEGGFLNLFIHL